MSPTTAQSHSPAPSVLTIPRQQWEQHPHFNTQTLLLGSHDNFRQINALLIQWCDEGVDASRIGGLYVRWISAMRSHESYEEHKLYRYLSHRWGVDFAVATAGHQALHDADHDVRAALVAAMRAEHDQPEPAITPPPSLRAALEHHDRVLCDHLLLEEDMVIPLLLELSPTEFQRYASSPIEQLVP